MYLHHRDRTTQCGQELRAALPLCKVIWILFDAWGCRDGGALYWRQMCGVSASQKCCRVVCATL